MARTLYVGNLAYSTTNEDLRNLFSQQGQVDTAEVVSDKFSGQSKGFGFVEMADAEAAQVNGDPLVVAVEGHGAAHLVGQHQLLGGQLGEQRQRHRRDGHPAQAGPGAGVEARTGRGGRADGQCGRLGDQPAPRRLDGGDRGRVPVRPLRAHDRRDRGRSRGAHRPVTEALETQGLRPTLLRPWGNSPTAAG